MMIMMADCRPCCRVPVTGTVVVPLIMSSHAKYCLLKDSSSGCFPSCRLQVYDRLTDNRKTSGEDQQP